MPSVWSSRNCSPNFGPRKTAGCCLPRDASEKKKVGIVAVSQKRWSARPGHTIVALYSIRFEKAFHEVTECGDVVLALVSGTGRAAKVVAKSETIPSVPVEPDPPFDRDYLACKIPAEIDTARFRISDRETAFGLRLRYEHLIKTAARYSEDLTLFRVLGSQFHPILTTSSETCVCGIGGSYGCGKMLPKPEECEPLIDSEYRKAYLHVLSTKTEGMYDIAKLEKTAPAPPERRHLGPGQALGERDAGDRQARSDASARVATAEQVLLDIVAGRRDPDAARADLQPYVGWTRAHPGIGGDLEARAAAFFAWLRSGDAGAR